jgi:NarL family two-component system response regulator LiaR
VRAVLVDDLVPYRVGLRRGLTALGIAVVGEASSGRDAVRLAKELRPDVVVIDPELGGIDAARQIAAMYEGPAVLVLADGQSETVLDALLAGACSFLFKADDLSDLAEAIRLAARGESSLAPTVARELVKRLRELETGRRLSVRDTCPSVLTGREQQVLTLLAQGRNNATIGQELFLSASTVKHHVARILGKLGATTRAQAAAQAARFGML